MSVGADGAGSSIMFTPLARHNIPRRGSPFNCTLRGVLLNELFQHFFFPRRNWVLFPTCRVENFQEKIDAGYLYETIVSLSFVCYLSWIRNLLIFFRKKLKLFKNVRDFVLKNEFCEKSPSNCRAEGAEVYIEMGAPACVTPAIFHSLLRFSDRCTVFCAQLCTVSLIS